MELNNGTQRIVRLNLIESVYRCVKILYSFLYKFSVVH